MKGPWSKAAPKARIGVVRFELVDVTTDKIIGTCEAIPMEYVMEGNVVHSNYFITNEVEKLEVMRWTIPWDDLLDFQSGKRKFWRPYMMTGVYTDDLLEYVLKADPRDIYVRPIFEEEILG